VGRAWARCTRPRSTHGYFIDRSAVATSFFDRSANQTDPLPNDTVFLS
jgi:hypothetical protein